MSGGQLFRPLHMNSFYRHMTIYIPVVTACPSYQADITKCCRVCFIIHMIESYRETVWERQRPVVSDRWVLAALNKLHVAATTWKYRNNTIFIIYALWSQQVCLLKTLPLIALWCLSLHYALDTMVINVQYFKSVGKRQIVCNIIWKIP